MKKQTELKKENQVEVNSLLKKLSSIHIEKNKTEKAEEKNKMKKIAKKLRRQLRAQGFYLSKQKNFQYGNSIVHNLISEK